MQISKKLPNLRWAFVCGILVIRSVSPASAGCLYDLCGGPEDAVNGTTIRVEVSFPKGHGSHEHIVLITGVDGHNFVVWWEEVSGLGSVFEAIVPKSVHDQILGVDAMIAGPPTEFDSAGTKRVSGPLPLGIMQLPIKRSMFH